MRSISPARLPSPTWRLAAFAAACLTIVGTVAYLLLVNYRSAAASRRAVLAQHGQKVQLQATALAHLLASANDDLRYVAESREVAAYHELGERGPASPADLADALAPLRERLEALVGGDTSKFARVELRDERDGRIAGSGHPLQVDSAPAEALDGAGLLVSPDRRRLVIVWRRTFHDRPAGAVVGWLRPAAVQGALTTSADVDFDAWSRLVDETGRAYEPYGAAGRGEPDLAALLAKIPPTGGVAELPAPGGGDPLVGVRVPLPGLPLALLHVTPLAAVAGELSEAAGARNLSIAAVALFVAAILALVLNVKSLVLKARLDESLRREQEVAEKHAALEREVSERRRLEQAHALLAQAVDQADEAIAVLDPRGAFEYANPSFERIWGYAACDIMGRSALAFEAGANPPELLAGIMERLGAGESWQGELTAAHRDGSRAAVEAVISPVRAATGTTVRFVAVARDVTEQKALQEQLRHAQKLEAIGTLAGGVAHDFNNLLTVINGYAACAMEELSAEDPLRETLGEIERAGRRAAALTRQLLAFGRRQRLSPVILDVNAVVTGVDKMLRRLIGEHIELTPSLAGDLPRVKVDPGQLEQVLVNLVVNARDAMPRGGRLRVETAHVAIGAADARRYAEGAPGDYVRLSVVDDGAGMDEATRARVFEPFFTTKEPGKGTGLGLATVYGIVRQSRGFVHVTSRPGAGARFDVFLPVDAGEEPGTVAPPAPRRAAAAGPPAGGRETILVVEDEAQVRNLVRAHLSSLGYEILTAGNGAEALAIARSHPGPIDLLFSDVVMPVMSGPELAQGFRRARPEALVVFASGHAEERLARQDDVQRAAAFLAKPFDLGGLAALVRSLLDDRARSGAA